MISRLLEIIRLFFCKRALQKRLYSAKETYTFKEPTNRSHPIPALCTSVTKLVEGTEAKMVFNIYTNIILYIFTLT